LTNISGVCGRPGFGVHGAVLALGDAVFVEEVGVPVVAEAWCIAV